MGDQGGPGVAGGVLRLTPVGAPVPAAETEDLVGVAADGGVVTRGRVGPLGAGMLRIVDPATGQDRARAALPLPRVRLLDGGRTAVLESDDGTERVELPLDPRAWAGQLCTWADRPFTPTELALLSEGTDPGPPCRALP